MGIVFVEIASKLIGWLVTNWKLLGWPLAGLFCFLWLHPSPAPQPVVAPPAVIQTHQEASASATTRVEIRYLPSPDGKPAPCPDIVVDNVAQTHHATDEIVNPVKCPAEKAVPYLGIEVSGAFPIYNASNSALGASVLVGSWRVGASYAPYSDEKRLELAHRWMLQ